MKLWRHLGFPSPQHYAAQVGANKRRIGKINTRLTELGWFEGIATEEGHKLDAEKKRLVDQIAPLPEPPEVPE